MHLENKVNYEVHQICNHNMGLRVKSEWKRDEITINEYNEITEMDSNYDKYIKTSVNGICEGEWCKSLDQLGPIDIVNMTWNTKWPWRLKLVECSKNCGWKAQWKNSQIQNKDGLKAGIDVKSDVLAWGVDSYTYHNIANLIPFKFNSESKAYFIDKSLKQAMLKCGRQGWDIQIALHEIQRDKNSPEFWKTLAKNMIGLLQQNPNLKEKYYKVHSIGVWVVWNSKKGIQANQFIQQFLGEVHLPHQWNEKQQITKRAQEIGIISESCEFYNIILDRKLDDEEGINFLVIDPKKNGNFCSRFNHSWNPNAFITSTISDNRYKWAVYAKKDIAYGEEITLNYYSITDVK